MYVVLTQPYANYTLQLCTYLPLRYNTANLHLLQSTQSTWSSYSPRNSPSSASRTRLSSAPASLTPRPFWTPASTRRPPQPWSSRACGCPPPFAVGIENHGCKGGIASLLHVSIINWHCKESGLVFSLGRIFGKIDASTLKATDAQLMKRRKYQHVCRWSCGTQAASNSSGAAQRVITCLLSTSRRFNVYPSSENGRLRLPLYALATPLDETAQFPLLPRLRS